MSNLAGHFYNRKGFTLQLKTKRFVIRGFLHGPFTSGGDKVPPYIRPPIYFEQGPNISIKLTDSLTQIVSLESI